MGKIFILDGMGKYRKTFNENKGRKEGRKEGGNCGKKLKIACLFDEAIYRWTLSGISMDSRGRILARFEKLPSQNSCTEGMFV